MQLIQQNKLFITEILLEIIEKKIYKTTSEKKEKAKIGMIQKEIFRAKPLYLIEYHDTKHDNIINLHDNEIKNLI